MNQETRTNAQYAPWPTELETAVVEFHYMDGWRSDPKLSLLTPRSRLVLP